MIQGEVERDYAAELRRRADEARERIRKLLGE